MKLYHTLATSLNQVLCEICYLVKTLYCIYSFILKEQRYVHTTFNIPHYKLYSCRDTNGVSDYCTGNRHNVK